MRGQHGKQLVHGNQFEGAGTRLGPPQAAWSQCGKKGKLRHKWVSQSPAEETGTGHCHTPIKPKMPRMEGAKMTKRLMKVSRTTAMMMWRTQLKSFP